MREFDLIVIGGGAAGEKGAVQAAYFGKKVALVEKEPHLGGAMVNTGTLPSKTLRETALYLSGFRQRGLHGVNMALGRAAQVDDFLFHLGEVVKTERERMRSNLAKHGVTVVHGAAKFVDPHTLEVNGETLSGKHFLIATGSRPHRPANFPFEHQQVYDSDEIVRLHTLPKTMVIVGGGVIGCEYASLFAALGTQVTIVESRGEVMGFLDGELRGWLMERMQSLGVRFLFNAQVSQCDATEGGVKLCFDRSDPVAVDATLICAGRTANTDGLQLENAGLVAGKRGQLEVDARFRTKVAHIAAAGDVIGAPALASTSMEQARVAVVDFFDLKYKTKVAPMFPTGIFTIPEVSMVGETEESLRAKNVAYVKGTADFAENARGIMIGETGHLKLLFRKDDMRLVGVHLIGEGATELVHIGLTAMLGNATAELFIDACFNYPTLSEAYKYATYSALQARGDA
ncbi:MAG: Si-specific NAD(P)(+) transhydrogenase [Archangium sp.]